MVRDMAKLRNVGGTLVVTLTQAILNTLEMQDGDRLLLEAIPPHRVMITKEVETMPSSRKAELELQVLERKQAGARQQIHFIQEQMRLHMPLDLAYDNPDIVSLTITQKETEIIALEVEIAQKQLELFDLQGQ